MELNIPLNIQTLGGIFSQASRGLRLHRTINSIEDEFDKKESDKFIQYLKDIAPSAAGFYYIPETETEHIIEENKRVISEMFSAKNREAIIHRHARKNKAGIADLRKISDPEVRILRAGLTSDLQRVFDRHLSLPEEQLLELSLTLM